jgi:hypothetical protein
MQSTLPSIKFSRRPVRRLTLFIRGKRRHGYSLRGMYINVLQWKWQNNSFLQNVFCSISWKVRKSSNLFKHSTIWNVKFNTWNGTSQKVLLCRNTTARTFSVLELSRRRVSSSVAVAASRKKLYCDRLCGYQSLPREKRRRSKEGKNCQFACLPASLDWLSLCYAGRAASLCFHIPAVFRCICCNNPNCKSLQNCVLFPSFLSVFLPPSAISNPFFFFFFFSFLTYLRHDS